MANNDLSNSEVSSFDNENDYNSLYDASQELLAKSSKLDISHKKLKGDFKELQRNLEKSHKEEKVLKDKILILENRAIKTIECASCKSYMLDLMILEKQLEDALENKSFEKQIFKKKNLSRNKYVPKNKIKRTRRVWVGKGTAYSINTCIATCFYCMKKRHTSNKCNVKHYDVPNGKYT